MNHSGGAHASAKPQRVDDDASKNLGWSTNQLIIDREFIFSTKRAIGIRDGLIFPIKPRVQRSRISHFFLIRYSNICDIDSKFIPYVYPWKVMYCCVLSSARAAGWGHLRSRAIGKISTQGGWEHLFAKISQKICKLLIWELGGNQVVPFFLFYFLCVWPKAMQTSPRKRWPIQLSRLSAFSSFKSYFASLTKWWIWRDFTGLCFVREMVQRFTSWFNRELHFSLSP